MLSVPTRSEVRLRPIETPRLVLSPIEPPDGSDLWRAVEASRPHLEPWLPWVPFTTDLETSMRYAEASALDWDNGRACRFAIRERSTKRFLGVVGMESLVHLHQTCDLGYWLRVDSTGTGYMTEASRAVVTWSFQRLNAHRVRVAASTENHRSLAVIRRLGFRFEGIAREAELCNNRWLDHALFSLLRREVFPGMG